MRYRAPLLSPATGAVDSDLLQLLTDAQLARLTVWSLQLHQPVADLLESARFMAEAVSDDSSQLQLMGELPHCKLFGCLMPDGSCHT